MYKNYADQLEAQSESSSPGNSMSQKTSSSSSADSKWRSQWNAQPVGDLWKKLSSDKDNKSLLKAHLTEALYKKYCDKKTKLGGTLAQCISSGSLHPGSKVGIYACDVAAYDDFADLFKPIIQEYHTQSSKGEPSHPEPSFGTVDQIKSLGDLDPSGKFVVSTRVRIARSHEDMPFSPAAKKADFEKMEKLAVSGLSTLTGELAGSYYPLNGMSPETQQKMIDDHFLFRADDSVLGDAGGYSCWDTGRGIFHNEKKTFLTWLNEEDHFRFISMQMGGNLGEVYKRLRDAITHMETKMKFAKKQGYGYLTFCPTNLGTTLRASVHVRIPMLAKNKDLMNKICEKYNLQPRGVDGEHSESKGGVYDISNRQRLGLTEFEAVEKMKNGVLELIAAEAKLWWEPKPLDDLWKTLSDSKSESLLKTCLTDTAYKNLKDKKTPLGGTLAHCINSGCIHLGSKVGIYACDPEAYTTFEEVLSPVIKAYHKVATINHPTPTFGTDEQMKALKSLDVDDMVVSTRIRVARSHTKYPFPPAANAEQFEAMAKDTTKALATLTGDLEGKYFPLATMDKETQNQMVADHFLFRDDDDVLRDAGGYNFWDIGRGIFHNKNKTFLVWVNEEDHLRLISMQKGGDLGTVYRRLVDGIHQLEKELDFAKKAGYGYLTFCPSNLGTTLRASVHMKIPLFSKADNFKKFCEDLNIQPRGIHGEHSESEGGVYDLSNKRRLGLTEYDAVTEMMNGIKAIQDEEIKLRKQSKK